MILRVRFILLLFVCCSCYLQGKAANKIQCNSITSDSAKVKIATAFLYDGTRIWGVLLNEAPDTLVITDFNAGQITIGRSKIKNLEISTFEGNIIIETVNGASYFGGILRLADGVLTIRSALLGTFEIRSNTISKITGSNAYVNRKGSSWFANPNATRYFFAPSAIPLKKQEGYYQNAYLLANSVNVGLTNNITIGGGVVIPLLFYVTPKVSFKVAKNFYLGAGILFTQSFISGFGLSAGIGYGLATYGYYEHNVTIGAGYGYAKFNTEYKNTPMPIVTVNGMTRIAKKLSLVTENWLIPRAGYNKEIITNGPYGEPYSEMVYENKDFYSGALSLGLRFMPGVRTSVDFSVVGIRPNPGQSDLILPYLDFVYKFN
ncbi:MAG: hypothetical protein A3F72_04230 [Bacteroidetes bacterium RIFCSPLOWO2_12_FULL_35_15]|nr:MAG: hypothetical protein A3F72_04230 [Bacteroidetes bacterium RIFCSPLOWO2_12_FULL_35_15]